MINSILNSKFNQEKNKERKTRLQLQNQVIVAQKRKKEQNEKQLEHEQELRDVQQKFKKELLKLVHKQADN